MPGAEYIRSKAPPLLYSYPMRGWEEPIPSHCAAADAVKRALAPDWSIQANVSGVDATRNFGVLQILLDFLFRKGGVLPQ